jgi:flagellar secretion chaperone FliS
MSPAFGAKRYKSVQITTSSPGGLLILLYDGLFRFLGEAADAIRAREPARAGERIDRCYAILTELAAGLDRAFLPDLCDQLEAIYLFCMGQLVEANLRKDPKAIDDVIRVLTPLRDAWRIAATSVPDEPAMRASA